MKEMGLLLVFISSTALGYVRAYLYKDKERELSAFLEFICFIRAEVSSYLTPQNKIYEKFNNATLEKNGFLSSLRHFLEQGSPCALSDALKYSELKIDGETRELLLSFANDFGTRSSEEECQRCDRTIKLLEEKHTKIKEETAEKTRLYRSMGSMVGIGLVLLLW